MEYKVYKNGKMYGWWEASTVHQFMDTCDSVERTESDLHIFNGDNHYVVQDWELYN